MIYANDLRVGDRLKHIVDNAILEIVGIDGQTIHWRLYQARHPTAKGTARYLNGWEKIPSEKEEMARLKKRFKELMKCPI